MSDLNHDQQSVKRKFEIGATSSHLDQRNTVKISLGEALEQVREGQSYQGQSIKSLISSIRELDTSEDDARRRLKGKLPVLVFAGYSRTNSRDEIEANLSGLVCADIDKLPRERVAEVREQLINDSHTLACFTSPSGNGFKVINLLPQPDASWADNYRQIEAYYKERLNLEIDPSCKNANRLCYLSYDPDIYINWDAERLPEMNIAELSIHEPVETTPVEPSRALAQAEALLELVPDHVGEHVDWIRFCGAISNFLQTSDHTPEQVLLLLRGKWPSEEDLKQLDKLVQDRRDTPIAAAEKLARNLCSLKEWRAYREQFPTEWNHWRHYVYNSVADELVDENSFVARSRMAFDKKYLSDRPVVTGEDGPKKVSPSDYTIVRCEEVAGKEYAPAEKRPVYVHANGEQMLNTYRPVNYEDTATHEETVWAKNLLTDHIAHMFSDTNEQAILIDYLAWSVQNPGRLKPWMVILYGVQGDGKSWFRELVEAALGEENVGVLQSSNLEDRFASPAYGKCMTFIEELKLDNVRKYDTLERLKSLLGNSRVSVREMRTAPREVRATANYLAATNHSDSLPVSDNERRFCVLTSQWVDRKPELRMWVEQNPDYYPTLYRAVREKPHSFREALIRHQVSERFLNMHEAPRTRGTLRMIEEAIPAGAVELRTWIEEWENQWINQDFIVLKELKRMHARESDRDRGHTGIVPQNMPTAKKLANYLSQLGYTKSDKRSIRKKSLDMGVGTKENVTVYSKPDFDIEKAFELYQSGRGFNVVSEEEAA